jgi:2'-5' RNA ligase
MSATPSSARLFIGLPIPASTQRALEAACHPLTSAIARTVPTEKLHLTLAFLGTVTDYERFVPALTAPLDLTFVPTIALTHCGRGQKRSQLWAYAHASTSLKTLREMIVQRLQEHKLAFDPKPFTPHITLATIKEEAASISDRPLTITFAPRQIHLYRSDIGSEGSRYAVLGSISLTQRL